MAYNVQPQNKEGILPVATLSIALCVLRRFMLASDIAPEVFININKYTSASENVHLSLKKNRQLGHISVATGRIPYLFCGCSLTKTSIRRKYLPFDKY